MARKDRESATDETAVASPGEPALNPTAPPPNIGRLRADADAAAREFKDFERKLEERRARAEAARAKFEAQIAADNEAEIKSHRAKAQCPVLVQTKNGEPVRLGGNRWVECLVPTMVTHRDLRKLENLRKRGAIQLIVGEIDKPGAVVDGKQPAFEKRNQYRKWMEATHERAAVLAEPAEAVKA